MDRFIHLFFLINFCLLGFMICTDLPEDARFARRANGTNPRMRGWAQWNWRLWHGELLTRMDRLSKLQHRCWKHLGYSILRSAFFCNHTPVRCVVPLQELHFGALLEVEMTAVQ